MFSMNQNYSIILSGTTDQNRLYDATITVTSISGVFGECSANKAVMIGGYYKDYATKQTHDLSGMLTYSMHNANIDGDRDIDNTNKDEIQSDQCRATQSSPSMTTNVKITSGVILTQKETISNINGGNVVIDHEKKIYDVYLSSIPTEEEAMEGTSYRYSYNVGILMHVDPEPVVGTISNESETFVGVENYNSGMTLVNHSSIPEDMIT